MAKILKKILIVDDDKLVRKMLVSALESWGYKQIYEAGDGLEAIEMVKKYHPDVIITDLTMPRMRGEELIRFVRINIKKDIKIIAMSGEEELEPVAFAAGCDDFLIKPFQLSTLEKKVSRF